MISINNNLLLNIATQLPMSIKEVHHLITTDSLLLTLFEEKAKEEILFIIQYYHSTRTLPSNMRQLGLEDKEIREFYKELA